LHPAPVGQKLVSTAMPPHELRTIASTGDLVRRYALLGLVAGWHVAWVTGTLALAGVVLGATDLLAIVLVLGVVAYRAVSSVTLELSPAGLTRGVMLQGRFVGNTTVMAWSAVANVHTDWQVPGDDSALATVVRDGEGRRIAFSTAMGLRDYWECLAGIVAAAPGATRSGLTDTMLAEGPPDRAGLVSAVRTAAGLAVVIAVFIAVHYLWAQGRSSLVRSLETSDVREPATLACDRPGTRDAGRACR
jgi:hypothetical protein